MFSRIGHAMYALVFLGWFRHSREGIVEIEGPIIHAELTECHGHRHGTSPSPDAAFHDCTGYPVPVYIPRGLYQREHAVHRQHGEGLNAQ